MAHAEVKVRAMSEFEKRIFDRIYKYILANGRQISIRDCNVIGSRIRINKSDMGLVIKRMEEQKMLRRRKKSLVIYS